MTSFTSSFSEVVLAPARRREYLAIAATALVVVVFVGVGSQIWLSKSTAGARKAVRELNDQTEIIIVGSSHLLGQHQEHYSRPCVNVSHAANSLEMISLTCQSSIHKTPHVRLVVVEIGTLVAIANPTQLRNHTFVELGVPPWSIPGSWHEKLWRCVERYPAFRIPRLTPRNLIEQWNPDINAQAQGHAVVRQGNYSENGRFRASNVLQTMQDNHDRIEGNLQSLRELLTLLKVRNIQVAAVITPHSVTFRELLTPEANELRKQQADMCLDFDNVHLIDLYDDESNGFTQEMFADSDHLNTVGHARLSQIIQAKTLDGR